MSEISDLNRFLVEGPFPFWAWGLRASLVVPATMLTATDAEARVGNPGSAVSVAGANRRDRRQDLML